MDGIKINDIHSGASPHLWYFVDCVLESSPVWWASSVATCCPCRPSLLKKKNTTKYHEWGDAPDCSITAKQSLICARAWLSLLLVVGIRLDGRPLMFLQKGRPRDERQRDEVSAGLHEVQRVVEAEGQLGHRQRRNSRLVRWVPICTCEEITYGCRKGSVVFWGHQPVLPDLQPELAI